MLARGTIVFGGLMQISYPTAKSMGFKGTPEDLLNPFVNLTYAVPYLANAFVIAGKEEDAAVRLYAAGYYFTARSKGLLGSLRTADSKPLSGVQDVNSRLALAQISTQIPEGPALFAQQTPLASLPEHKPASMPEGKTGDSVAMAIGKGGDATPPKKWTRDGGISLIARGEQPIEQIAAYGQAPGIEAKGAPVAEHGHVKTTIFAAIYMPPSAQAYAPSPSDQNDRLTQTPAQAAIAQMASGSTDAPPVTSDASETQPAVKKKHVRARRSDKSANGKDTAADVPKSRNAHHGVKAEFLANQDPDTSKNSVTR